MSAKNTPNPNARAAKAKADRFRKARMPGVKKFPQLLNMITQSIQEAAAQTDCWLMRITFEPLTPAAANWIMPGSIYQPHMMQEYVYPIFSSNHNRRFAERDYQIGYGSSAMMVNNCALSIQQNGARTSGSFQYLSAAENYASELNGFLGRQGCVSTLLGLEPYPLLHESFMRIYVTVIGSSESQDEACAFASRAAIANFCKINNYNDLTVINED